MSVIRTIGRGIAWSTAGTFVAKVVGFGNIFLVLTHLTVYEYGLTELTMSVVSTVGMLMLPGLLPIVVADLGVERARKEYGQMKMLFLEYFTMTMALGVIAWAFLFFGSSVVAHFTGNDLIDRFFKIVAFLFLLSPLRAASTMLATVFVRYADQSIFNVVEEVAKGALLCVFFFVLGKTADGLLYATVLAQAVAILVFLPRTLSAMRVFWSARIDNRKPFWLVFREHRKWGVAASYVGTFSSNLRLWLIKIFLGTEAVGLFAFAFGIISHISSLVPLGGVLTPMMPGFVDRRADFARLIRSGIKLQVWLSIVLTVGALIVSPLFVTILFPKYEAALPVLMLLLCVLIPSSVGPVMTPAFAALKEQRSQFFSVVVRVISISVFSPMFIFTLGLPGSAVEVFVTTLVTVTERLWRLNKLLPEFRFSFRALFKFETDESRIGRALLSRIGIERYFSWMMRG